MKPYQGEHAIIAIPSNKTSIENAGITIYSLLINSPEFHICLHLYTPDFPNGYDDLPPDIQLLARKSLIEIKWVDNIIIGQPLSINDEYRCIQVNCTTDCIYSFNYAKEMVNLYYKLYKKIPSSEPYDVIVSLTTWKGRIHHAEFPNNLLSLLNQETKYKFKVVLVLSQDEFIGEDNVPYNVLKLQALYDNFEILWTGRNTKALKNYNPTAQKYPDLPIIVIGDDTIYDKKLVDTVYTTYKYGNKRACYGAFVSHSSVDYNIDSPWRIRLFPPHAMHDLDDDYFDQYFYGHNDLFNGLRLRLNNTPVIEANWNGLWHESFAQEVRLRNYRSKPEHEIISDFLSVHPEYIPIDS